MGKDFCATAAQWQQRIAPGRCARSRRRYQPLRTANQQFLKDPATGKRVSRANPESEWLRQDVPELRIVDEALWQRAQRLRESRSTPHFHQKRRPQRLFSGLIYCGCCGARYNIVMRDYLRCSARANSGTCTESRSIKMGDIEQRALAAIEEHLLAPEMVEAAATAYREEIARSQSERDVKSGKLEGELTEIERKFARLLRMVEEGHADPAVAGPRLNELSRSKQRLVAELNARPAAARGPITTDGGASYRLLVADLRTHLADESASTSEAAQLVRGLVRRITVLNRLDEDAQPLEIEAGYPITAQTAEQYCEVGCGGLHWAIQPAGSDGSRCVMPRTEIMVQFHRTD